MTRMQSRAADGTRILDLDHDPVAAAHDIIVAAALTETPAPDSVASARVGLELEFHLVDLARPAVRPTWDRVLATVAALPPMPRGSAVTTEPGGQLELSTPPTLGVAASIADLGADTAALRAALAADGLGLAALGTDPYRPPARINPSPRYVAMEAHFAAVGCLDAGTAMMTATAALQVNLDAGPATGWVDRLALVHALGPVLVAVSAGSPYLGGRASGWASMRQQAWLGIDRRRSGPVRAGGRTAAFTEQWAAYALDAPVLLVRDDDAGTAEPVRSAVPFRAWLDGSAPIARRPTGADLDYHLTTLFPPVRPRGYLELRCLDAVPDAWWPALAALTVTLIDDPVAADAAAEAVAPLRDAWPVAARDGLADPALRRAARACVAVARERCEPGVREHLDRLGDLVDAGRGPGDELRERMVAAGPLTILEEEARA